MTLIVILFALFMSATSSLAATRLGLHVTQEELNVWRARMTDNVNTVNGHTYQSIYQSSRILGDANSFRSQSHPGGDGFWSGWTGSGCNPSNGNFTNPGSGGTPYDLGNGGWMMRAAFNFLLTGDTSYADPVRAELLNQITVPGTDFSNRSKWCIDTFSGSNMHFMVPWVYRMLISYDYLIAGGYAGFSAGEKASIVTWFSNAARFLADVHNRAIDNNIDYPGVNDTPQSLTCHFDCTSLYPHRTHQGGWQIRNSTYAFSNQSMYATTISMAVGIIANDSTLIEVATDWMVAFINVGIYDDGAVPDYSRWEDCTPHCPGSTWGHAGAVWYGMVAMADMYARAGNTSLYDLTVPTQVLGGNGGMVNIKQVIRLAARLAAKTTVYMTGDGTHQISWDITHEGNFSDFYHHFAGMIGNLYFRDAEIKTGTHHNLGRGIDDCFDNRLAGCFAGGGFFWADIPFMFGNMENNPANPYITGAGDTTLPEVTITGPTSNPTFTSSVSPQTISGTCTDNVVCTQVTWTNSLGGGGTASGIANWSFLVVYQSGQNIITVTGRDAALNQHQDVITVSYTPPVVGPTGLSGATGLSGKAVVQ